MNPLYSEDDIREAIARAAPDIVAGLGSEFVMIPILTGGFIFGADLARALYSAGADPEIDFLQLSSYGTERETSGTIRLLKDVTVPVEGQKILLVDDVLDTGRSLDFAKQLLVERGAQRVDICVAVDKTVRRDHAIKADYALFRTDRDDFLVGYGMDDAGQRRGLPCISKV